MEPVSLELRPVRTGDLPRLAELERSCFSAPWSEAQLEALLSNSQGKMLAAVRGDKIVGYVSWEQVLDEAQVANLEVDPAWRRQGIARQLVSAMISQARSEGASRLTLEVQAGKAGARRLYEEQGFVPTGLRKGYYKIDRDDAILMDLRL